MPPSNNSSSSSNSRVASPVFPLRAVAALFIERQHLTRPRARLFSAARVGRFIADAGGLQLDSINVIDRAHYLTVWSRFGAYDRRALDRLAYERRRLFEYWAHAACLVPTEHFPAWRRAMLDYHTRSRGWARWLKKNRPTLAAVEQAIRQGGPLGSADFAHRRRPKGEAGWWNWKPTTHALDYLWMSGRTLVHSRRHFHKRFDLAERLMPEALAREALSGDDFQRWHLTRSLHAMGAATELDLRMYLSFPRVGAPERRRWLKRMIEEGEVVEVGVEPSCGRTRTTWYALAADRPALAAADRRGAAAHGTTLFAPFDSFLWHRDRTYRLFGFRYTIEVYTPGHKRVHGYYTLPIFHDGQLIGRVDPKIHRAERRLEIKWVHFEPWFARGHAPPAASWGRLDQDAALAGLADAFRSLAEFVHADAIDLGQVSPSRFRAALRALLHAAPIARTDRPEGRRAGGERVDRPRGQARGLRQYPDGPPSLQA